MKDPKRAADEAEKQPGRVAADWIHLQELIVDNATKYTDDLAQLVADRSLEPSQWVESGTNFWRGLARDFGEWMRLPPNLHKGEYVVTHVRISADTTLTREGGGKTIAIGLSPLAFGPPTDENMTLKLELDAFMHTRGRAMLLVSEEVSLDPMVVSRSSVSKGASVNLIFHRVAPRVATGDYRGVIWAKRDDGAKPPDVPVARYPVAVVEITVQ